MTYYDLLTKLSLDDLADFLVQPLRRNRFGSIDGEVYANREDAVEANRRALSEELPLNEVHGVTPYADGIKDPTEDDTVDAFIENGDGPTPEVLYGLMIPYPLPFPMDSDMVLSTLLQESVSPYGMVQTLPYHGIDHLAFLFREQNEAKIGRNILRNANVKTGQIIAMQKRGEGDYDLKEGTAI